MQGISQIWYQLVIGILLYDDIFNVHPGIQQVQAVYQHYFTITTHLLPGQWIIGAIWKILHEYQPVWVIAQYLG